MLLAEIEPYSVIFPTANPVYVFDGTLRSVSAVDNEILGWYVIGEGVRAGIS